MPGVLPTLGQPTLLHGDCLDLLPTLEAESIDAIVTDPPAGIGFMHSEKAGRTWDSLADHKPRTERGQQVDIGLGVLGLERWARGFVVFLVDVFTETLRVAKPGTHALVWALPRTADLTGLALRLAGWECRDSLVHMFACLTDDAEILTEHGWTHCRNLAAADLALCYDVEHGTYQWQQICERFDFTYSGEAYRVRGDGVDHTVTPDHRCVDGGRFITAQEAAREHEIHVPTPEGLHGLRGDVDGNGPLPGAAGEDVRPELPGRGHRRETPWSANIAARDLLGMREALLAQDPCGEAAPLLGPLLRHLEEQGPDDPRTHGQDCPDGRRRDDARCDCEAGSENARGEQSRVEGRGYAQQEQGELSGGAVCSITSGVPADGTPRWLHRRASTCSGTCARSAADIAGNRSPHQPRSAGQSSGESDAVQVASGPHAVRSARFAPATVERVQYTGRMWCVTVPTGAFVARTAAGVFVTGNSGFPKSHDVSKAIDKMHGAERPVIGRRTDGVDNTDRSMHKHEGFAASREQEFDVTAPATEDAKRWEGWGTALSPGHEQWILARAPLVGTVARNVLEYGTGAINIDATRTPCDGGSPSIARRESAARSGWTPAPPPCGFERGAGDEYATQRAGEQLGRWPKNAMLSCSLACEGDRHTPWCPVGELDRQSGESHPHGLETSSGDSRLVLGGGLGTMGRKPIRQDSGGASRYFPRFRYEAKASDRSVPGREDLTNRHATIKSVALMRWMVRLITPPGGVVLDQFMGSGTTGVAAAAEGCRFIGIERDADSFEVARARNLAAVGSPEYAAEANTHAPQGAQLGLL
jgi:DNA modification methylase